MCYAFTHSLTTSSVGELGGGGGGGLEGVVGELGASEGAEVETS